MEEQYGERAPKALYKMFLYFLLVEYHFTQVISFCCMVGKGYHKNTTIFYYCLQFCVVYYRSWYLIC